MKDTEGKMGSPIKGKVKKKNTSPAEKKSSFFFLAPTSAPRRSRFRQPAPRPFSFANLKLTPLKGKLQPKIDPLEADL